MNVLHVAAGKYPTEGNPVACIFVKKLVEMQRSRGLDSRVLDAAEYMLAYFNHDVQVREERLIIRSQKGLGKLPSLLQERYFDSVFSTLQNRYSLRPDIIHCHFSNNAPLGKELSSRFDCPYLVTLHENHWWFEDLIVKDPNRCMEALVASDMVTRPNSIDIIDLYKWEIPYEKIMYLQNYVDEKTFRIPSEIERAKVRSEKGVNNKKVIINIASLHKKKGHELLINSIAILKKQIPELKVWIIGEGPEENSLRHLSNQLGVQEIVGFLGRIDNHKIQSYLSCGDLFAFPSIAESFGISQVEGMLTGLPVVATRNFGSEDIVLDGHNGFIVSSRDPKEYADCLLEALTKTWDQYFIRQSAVERFGSDIVYDKLLKLYESLIENHYQDA
jgi:glycosyltransferase involved in cell wall biosynthesis